MAPHLMRAQGAYKADKQATPTHTHPQTPHTPMECIMASQDTAWHQGMHYGITEYIQTS